MTLSKAIIQALKATCDITLSALDPLSVGADIDAVCYKGIGNGKTYFIKLKKKGFFDIIPLLQDAGVPHLIPLINKVAMGDQMLYLYPFIEGESGFTRELTDQQWMALGEALQKMHTMDVPRSIVDNIRHETYRPVWSDLALDMPRSLDAHASRLYKLMQEHYEAIEQLVERAERLGKQLLIHPPQNVLCHSDLHAGNMLISTEGEIYIVDWDEVMMAPKERDLMFIGGGVGNVWNRPARAFYQGYGDVEINQTALAYYRYARIAEDLAIYQREVLSTSTPPAEKATMIEHVKAMFTPNGVVDIAFNTKHA